MRLPLPLDTQNLMTRNELIKKITNLGLLLNKYVCIWSDDWTTEVKRDKEKVNLKTEFLNRIKKESIHSKEGEKFVEALLRRQFSMLAFLQNSIFHVQSFTAITDSRLIIGLGGTSVIETGMTLHPLYGFPYLPGSGLKGLARAYAEIAVEPHPTAEELREIFGSEDKNPHNVEKNRQGRVFFMDALPVKFPKLELDIMNPHYIDYYQGKKDSKGNLIPPADYLDPVPVTFLTVAKGQDFMFAIYSRDANLLLKAKEWLIGGLKELGVGGKTNVGYGYFRDFRDVIIEEKSIKPLQPKDDIQDLNNRIKSIKNLQTFDSFLKTIKENEIKLLKDISFKGMESVINIGLLSCLEISEISEEIKKIIAKKILEVCKEPDKKYKEKLEKYRKLQKLAGEGV